MATEPTNATSGNPDLLVRFVAQNKCTCPLCHADLSGISRPACPRCKCDLRLQVGVIGPRFGWFLMFLVPLMAIVGIALFFGVLVIVIRKWPAWGFYPFEALALLDIAAGIAAYRRRRWFMRQSPRRQVLLALAAWVVNLVIGGGAIFCR